MLLWSILLVTSFGYGQALYYSEASGNYMCFVESINTPEYLMWINNKQEEYCYHYGDYDHPDSIFERSYDCDFLYPESMSFNQMVRYGNFKEIAHAVWDSVRFEVVFNDSSIDHSID